jgi:hypothetical protein
MRERALIEKINFFSRNEYDQKISISNPTNCCLFIYVKVKHNFKELGKLITCFFKENLNFFRNDSYNFKIFLYKIALPINCFAKSAKVYFA